MKIVIASDSYKGSLSSYEVGEHIRRGFKRVLKDAEYTVLAVADGGEGTLAAIAKAKGAMIESLSVMGPEGHKVEAKIGFFDDKAILEVASASGLNISSKKDIFKASSYGTGELIRYAVDKGCKKLYIGLGGSATNDAGIGLLQALGVSFYDDKKEKLGFDLHAYKNLSYIEAGSLKDKFAEIEVVLLSDVDNPLCGDRGASFVFALQKGAKKQELKELDEILAHVSDIALQKQYPDHRDTPGSGAAGGIGFALLTFLNARIVSGVDFILDSIEIDKMIEAADLIVTGEGQMDYQTAYGKLPVGVAQRGLRYKKPVAAIVGSLGKAYQDVYSKGISAIEDCISHPQTLEEALNHAGSNIEDAAERLIRKLQINIV